MNLFPVRKSIRLAPLNYVGYQCYFVTLCSFHRRNVFSDSTHCQELLSLLNAECASRNFSVLAYCVMPDHLHFLAKGLDPASRLLHLLKSFKIKSSRKYAACEGRTLWLKGFYQHILRPGENLESVAWYIWLNPVRKRLVSRAQDYPFSGSFNGMKMPVTWDAPDWRPPWK
jgi:REP element-mobilizing transposase RayT